MIQVISAAMQKSNVEVYAGHVQVQRLLLVWGRWPNTLRELISSKGTA